MVESDQRERVETGGVEQRERAESQRPVRRGPKPADVLVRPSRPGAHPSVDL